MMNFNKKTIGLGITLVTSSSSIWAGSTQVPVFGGSLVYSPDVQQAVPTLSGWMLITLAFLFGVIAFRTMRQKHGRALASLTAAGIVAAGASGGVKLIEDAHAVDAAIPLSVAAGSTVQIPVGPARFQNTTNVPQRIRSITYNSGCGPTDTPPTPPVCSLDLPPIQPQAECSINTQCSDSIGE